MNGNGSKSTPLHVRHSLAGDEPLHPAWSALIRYCTELQFGELEKVKIQDGLPMMVEVTTRKVKFGT